jgi:vancomycin permeability regulator SanA
MSLPEFPPPTLAELRARPDDPDMRRVLLEAQHARLALLDIIALANEIEDIASTHDYQVNAKRYRPRRALLARLREEIKRVGPVIDSPVSHAEKQFLAHQRRLQQDHEEEEAERARYGGKRP